MDVKFTPGSVKVEIWITPVEARVLIEDFNHQIEPSLEGKKLYGALSRIGQLDVMADDFLPEDKPLPKRSPQLGLNYSAPRPEDLTRSPRSDTR